MAVKEDPGIGAAGASGAEKGLTERRLEALLDLMDKSLAPALALMPSAMRAEISESYERFKELMDDGNADSR